MGHFLTRGLHLTSSLEEKFLPAFTCLFDIPVLVNIHRNLQESLLIPRFEISEPTAIIALGLICMHEYAAARAPGLGFLPCVGISVGVWL